MNQLPTTDAFISYSRANLGFVEQLAADLANRGKEPWFDRSDVPLRGIPAGSEWWHEIEQGIEAADNFCFVISPDSVVSPFCNAEIAHALRHSKRKVTVMFCDQGEEAATLTAITQAVNAIPEGELVPELVSVPERQLRRLVRYNWQRISAVQYIPFLPDRLAEGCRQLASALDQDIERVRALGDLQRSAAAWDRQARSASFLLRGDALKEAEELLRRSVGHDPEPSSLQLEYVSAGRQDENRRRRLSAAGISVAVLLTLAALIAAVLIRSSAVRERAEIERTAAEERANLQATAAAEQAIIAATAVAAEAEAQLRRQQAEDALRLALSRQLAAESARQLDGQLDLALLLSVAAYQMEGTVEAGSSLLDSLNRAVHMQAFLHGGQEKIQSLAWSPDGRLLAAGTCLEERYFGVTECIRGGVLWWDTVTGELLGTLEVGLDGDVPALAFGPDGRWLAVGGCYERIAYAGPMKGCVQGAVELWDLDTRQPIGPALLSHRNPNANQSNQVGEIAISRDGRRLAGSGIRLGEGVQGTVTLWDLETGQAVGEPLLFGGMISGLAFSPADDLLAASSLTNDAVAVWRVTGGRPAMQRWTAELPDPGWLAFSPDGLLLAVSHGDGQITLLDVGKGEPVGEPLEAELGIGGPLGFSADGAFLVSAGSGAANSNDNRVTVWNVARRKLAVQLAAGTPWAVTAIALAPDRHRLASGSVDGTLLMWDLDSLHPLATPLNTSAPAVLSVAVSPDGQLAASGSGNAVQVWDLATGDQVVSYTVGQLSWNVTDMAFGPGGDRLIACTFNWGQNVALLDVRRGLPIAINLEGHSNECFGVAYSSTGEMAASSSLDGTIILWDPASGRPVGDPLTDIPADEGSSFRSNDVWGIDFSPDGRLLASARGGGDILLWDVARREPAGEPILAHAESAMSVAFSPDGRLLASAGGDWLIRLWDPATGTMVGEPLAGHTDNVFTLAFSPDGRTLASGSWDKTIRLWDVASGRAIGSGISAGSSVNRIAYLTDGHALLSDVGPLALWELRPEPWMAAACRIANRRLTAEEWRHYLGDQPYQPSCSAAR